MTHELTDHVAGFGDDEVAALTSEAERGYDLDSLRSEPNPHSVPMRVVPSDLVERIERRAAETGTTPDEVVRDALTAYLDSA